MKKILVSIAVITSMVVGPGFSSAMTVEATVDSTVQIKSAVDLSAGGDPTNEAVDNEIPTEEEGVDGEEEAADEAEGEPGPGPLAACNLGFINLTATTIGGREIRLDFIARDGEDFTLQRMNGANDFTSDLEVTVNGNDNTYTDTDGITPNESYTYRIFRSGETSNLAYAIAARVGDTNVDGVVDLNDENNLDGSFTTNDSDPEWLGGDFDGNGIVDFDDYVQLDLATNSQPQGASPVNLTATISEVDGHSITLNWDPGFEGNNTHFRIERRTSGNNFAEIDNVPFSTTSFTDSDTTGNGTYYFYRVQSYGATDAGYSNIVNPVTLFMGDANADGYIDQDDYDNIQYGFEHQGDKGFEAAWKYGDFDGNGVIDFDDFVLIDSAYNACAQFGGIDDGGAEDDNGNDDDDNNNNGGGGGRSNRRPANGGGEVLGATTGPSCSGYLLDYIKFGANNDAYNVALLQDFLNGNMNAGLPLTGIYDATTMGVVNNFQVKYFEDVLSPWVPLGLPTEKTSTGYVYKTTKHKIDELFCNTEIPMPMLP